MLDPSLIQWVTVNVGLALIPVGAGYAILGLAGVRGKWAKAAAPAILILGFVWLIFLPNTAYLLSEWRHWLRFMDRSNMSMRLANDSGAALTFMNHTLFYLCFSSAGMLTFALAIRPVAQAMKARGANLWVWGIPLFLLCSVGVYLGLILRFNSWEMISRPGDVWAAVVSLMDHPVLSSFLIAFAAGLWILYLIVDIWIDGLRARISGGGRSRGRSPGASPSRGPR